MFGWLIRLFKKKKVREVHEPPVKDEKRPDTQGEPDLIISHYGMDSLPKDLFDSEGNIDYSNIFTEPPESKFKCPRCKEGYLVQREGKFGKFIGCDEFPYCKYTRDWDTYIYKIANEDEKWIHNYFGIIRGARKCYQCHSMTIVSGMALTSENIQAQTFPDADVISPTGYDIYIVPWSKVFEQLPRPIQEYVLTNYAVKPSGKHHHYQNICENCKAVQGDFYTYISPDSSDSPFSHTSAVPLILERLGLGNNEFEIEVQFDSVISPPYRYMERTIVMYTSL